MLSVPHTHTCTHMRTHIHTHSCIAYTQTHMKSMLAITACTQAYMQMEL